MEMLKIWDFHIPQHAEVFDAIREQYAKGNVIDEVVLGNRLTLSNIDQPEDFLFKLTLDVPSAAGIENYCTILKAWTQKRREFEAAAHLIDGNSSEAMEVLNRRDSSDATVSTGSHELELEIEREISGERNSLPLPNWPELSKTHLVGPGTISMVCGSPGVSKSFFALEPVWMLHFKKIQVAIMELESGPKYHCRRALAQMSGKSRMTDIDWIKNHPQEARDICVSNREYVEEMRKVIFSPHPSQKPTGEFLLQWMRRMSDKGARLLVIDPITIMAGGDMRFLDHERFADGARAMVEKYENSLLLVMHPKDSNGDIAPSMSNLPCSKIWERTCSGGIVWLERHETMSAKFPEPSNPLPSTISPRPYNRTLHTLKVRSAKNPGKIYYWFNIETLRHEERGVLPKE